MAFFPQQQQQQQQQQQPNTFRNFAPTNGQINVAPIPFFANSSFPDRSNPSFVNVMGLSPGAVSSAVATAGDGSGGVNGWEPRSKRIKERDLLEGSQISSVDFLQTGSVSTGLGLSLNDRRVGASYGESQQVLLPMMDEEFEREMQRMDAEMDRFVRLEGERLRQTILEKVQAKQLLTLASVEETILRKVRYKELEVEDINKKNLELEGQFKQLTFEVSSWQERAKYYENMINSLKYNMEQLYAQNRNNKEGCGDSELDDTASCCNGDVPMESMACKVCGANKICMLLLPCQHLCLCKECESKLSHCPLCRTSKLIGMEIYM